MTGKIRSFVFWTGAFLIVAGTGLPPLASAFDIIGAGATFPFPVYGAWADAYKQKTGNSLNYQSIGSGGGIKQIQNKTVDFGASDMPLAPDALDKDGLMQFPTVIGGDVPVVNLKGMKPGGSETIRDTDCGYLPWQDHQVERPGNQCVESRR